MKAEILTIGDELLRGEIVDSNKSHLSERLLHLDIETHFHSSVRDEPDDMRDAFLRAVGRADVVLVSGGLGPTRDDLTADVLAQTFGRELVLDEASLEAIQSFFSSVGREMSDNNRKQAYFPAGSDVLVNPIGTAPGFMIEAEGSAVFCLPGVPRELYLMMDEQVMPRLEARAVRLARETGSGAVRVARARLLRTFGMGESTLDAELKDLATGPDLSLGFRTAFPDNYLRPVARGANEAEAEGRLETLCGQIRERLGALVYGEGDETLQAVVGRLLRERGKTLSAAESCSGGLIASKLIEVPGSSAYFRGGVVAYADTAKAGVLGVPEALLSEHGAVSEPVARSMAEGARRVLGTDLAVATTGIAGPGGGSEGKPVGLVFVALAGEGETACESFVFPLDRTRHRQLSSQIALDWVRRRLLGAPLEGPTLMRRRGASSAPGGGGAKS